MFVSLETRVLPRVPEFPSRIGKEVALEEKRILTRIRMTEP
jgi:hypothetical protein